MANLLRILLIAGVVPAAIYGGMTWGYRAGQVELGTIFQSLGWLVPALMVGGVVLLVVAVLSFISKRAGLGLVAVIAALGSLAMAAGPVQMKKTASQVPPIHDITTDVEDPPAFVATAPMRTEGMNPAAYDAGQTDRQLEAYPDLVPIEVAASPDEAFEAALKAAKDEGLAIAASDKAAGTIEGTATTRWFGFKDDVIIRIRANGEGSIIDIRSKSRVGGSDVGANAARIRALRTRILASLDS
ncbi:DUF1499 domain-containing protein [Parvularcula sp. LCG005]|uniref:DUF1499 domain-containing protein n=1 Tax=Parvularcula sp. LCG005 TaxID=3078805 RepID=UPI002942B0A2|nr:DUF1499 domain-containing protein [Parvularcula sp. LCG005]WOI54691.1 DUF1499 domain-containing protein [Parvularcula sp. LCG005]